MKIKRITTIIMLLSFVFILPACSQKASPEEEIYTTLEKVVTIEDSFEEQQEPLVKLEEKEKGLYDKIISLGMKKFDEIVKLSNEAIASVDERSEKIKKEKESINKSRKYFKNVLPSINKIEDESLKKEANGLYTLMEDRYKAYDELSTNYAKALTYDKELYQMFKKKDLSIDELESQIEKINKTYEKVMKANDNFNGYTDKYNKAKLAFYKDAGLDVQYKESKTDGKK